MGVSDGQNANQTTFNNAFMHRNADSNTIGKQDFQNTDAASGPDVINIQREVNSLNSFSGRISGSAKDVKPVWVNNDVGVSTDDVKQRADLLTQKFNLSIGHKHTGAAGDAPNISAADLANVPNRPFITQGTNLTAVGLDDDISAQFVLKVPSTASTIEGVPSTSPQNRVFIKDAVSLDPIEDGSGNEVYGRVTNTGGVGGTWILTYYVDIAGVETPYSFSSTLISFWYQELFSALSPNAPVYSQAFNIPSDNATNDVVDATLTQAGKVSTAQQTFGGEKNFDGGFATERQDVASAATIIAFSSSKSFARITGATATDLQGIAAPTGATNKRLIIYNASSAVLTVSHEDAGAIAVDRIVTPEAADMDVAAGASIEFIYDDAQSRWIVVSSGAGAGGGQYEVLFTEGVPQNVTAVGGVDLTGQGIRTMVFIQGSGGAVEVTANPQIDPGVVVGDELLVWGKSDTNTVTLNDGTGLSLNGQITLGDNDMLKLVWSGTVWAEQSRSV